jgi:hypothetical protein
VDALPGQLARQPLRGIARLARRRAELGAAPPSRWRNRVSGTQPWNSAARGGMPPGSRWSGQDFSTASAASAPPEAMAAHGTPRATASCASARVSSVFPELLESTASAERSTHAGQ